VLSLPVLLGVTNAKLLAERLDPSYVFTRLKQPLPPTLSDLIATVALRPIFSSAAAYIIFRLLLPCDHPQAFKTLASFLSLPIFQRLGVLTYSIYINHFRILFEVVFSGSGYILAALDSVYGTNRGFLHFSTIAVITFSASLVISVFQYYVVEKPVQGALTRWLLFGWNSHSRRAKDKVKAGE